MRIAGMKGNNMKNKWKDLKVELTLDGLMVKYRGLQSPIAREINMNRGTLAKHIKKGGDSIVKLSNGKFYKEIQK